MNQVSITDELVNLAKPFDKQNSYDLAFESECLFAKQQITKNDFTLKTATNNPGSLRNAILNVAAIGISLNPAAAHAYLVPRDGMVCLDISYRGLVKLATDAGSIEWAKSVLVYEGDTFQWRGPTQEPLHEADVFDKDRINAADPLQNLKGGYCLAKLSTGEYMVEVMTAGEILEVKNTSKAQNGPWKGRWAGEMAKKTLVKRAYKSWPQSGGRERLDQAISILNQHEGLMDEKHSVSEYLKHSPEQEAELHAYLNGDPVDYFLWWRGLSEQIATSLYNSFQKGEKGVGKRLCDSTYESGNSLFADMLDALTEACEREDDLGAREILEDLPDNQKSALIDALDVGLVRFANSIGEAA